MGKEERERRWEGERDTFPDRLIYASKQEAPPFPK